MILLRNESNVRPNIVCTGLLVLETDKTHSITKKVNISAYMGSTYTLLFHSLYGKNESTKSTSVSQVKQRDKRNSL